ncbi:lipoprotein insertase outer membrane protein LolB [Hydrogenophaga sp. XSHU_21]
MPSDSIDRRSATLALAALLAGCATPRPPAGGDSWSGRLALRVDSTPPQAFSARFDLEGSARAGELRLSSVLGQTLATVRWSPAGAELQRGSDITRRGSLDELTGELSGAALPVAAMFDWLAGRASETGGWRADLSAQPQGRFSARREQPLPVAELRVVMEP